jgi:tRNA(fMet)-specific endonuclease VapC
MSTMVVDTDVLSFMFKADTRAVAYRARLNGSAGVISFMTLSELDRWSLARNWGLPRRERLKQMLRRFVVCYANRDLCRLWAEISEHASGRGCSIACADAWIAAVALLLDSPLLTHNPRDYRGVEGLRIITEAPF